MIGEGIEAGIDQQGRLYTWSPKTQLSYLEKATNDFATRENLKLVASNVKQAAFNRLGLWILLDSGSIQFRPVFNYKNKSGEVTKSDFMNKILNFNSMTDIVQISAGQEHVLALNKDGLVFCYGDDTLG